MEKEGGYLSVENKKAAHSGGSVSAACVVSTGEVGTPDYSISLSGLQQEVSGRFQPKKADSMLLSDVYFTLGLTPRAQRVSDCGTYLEYHVSEEKKRLHFANFCKDRLCPLCNWRRSLKIFGQVSQVMNRLEQDKFKFLFLTLTVRNCSASDLPETVDKLFLGWRYMYNKSSVFRRSVAGSFRSLEVTRNSETGEFHPHFHVILAVRPSYFKKGYLTQAQWADLWRDSCDLSYNPVVDIRTVSEGIRGVSGAVAEVSKYAVKPVDFLRGSLDEQVSFVSAFLSALTRRRLCSFTGCFAQARKQIGLDDVETGDLVRVDGDDLRDDVAFMVVRYSWRAGVYVLQ